MTPRQARAARAMLAMDLKTAASLIGIAKRTLSEFEAGVRTINRVTAASIEVFYRMQGVVFGCDVKATDAVAFRNGTGDQPSLDSVRPKAETANLLDHAEVADQIANVEVHLAALQEAVCVSRNLMRSIVMDAGIERVQVAHRLAVTPSFVSAIIMGQKLLPLSHAEAIAEILNIDADITDALRRERLIKKNLEKIARLLADAKSEMTAVSQPPSSTARVDGQASLGVMGNVE